MRTVAPLIVMDSVGTPSARYDATERLDFVDAARVFATFAVVWVHVVEVQGHTPSVAAVGRFGTSFYLAIVVLLAIRDAEAPAQGSWSDRLRRRARRLLGPFVGWSLAYGVFYGLDALRRGDDVSDLALWWGPFAGTARHLWFLPFAFTAGLVVSFVAPFWARASHRVLFWSTLGVTAIGYVLCHGVLFFAVDRAWLLELHLHRLDRWLEEIPLLCLATGGLLWTRRKGRAHTEWLRARGKLLGWLALGTFTVVEVIYASALERLRPFTGSESRFFAHAAGLLLLAGFASLARSKWVRWLSPVGRSTYFVFLAHVLVLDWVGRWVRIGSIGALPLAFVTTTGVFCVCLLLHRHLLARTASRRSPRENGSQPTAARSPHPGAAKPVRGSPLTANP